MGVNLRRFVDSPLWVSSKQLSSIYTNGSQRPKTDITLARQILLLKANIGQIRSLPSQFVSKGWNTN